MGSAHWSGGRTPGFQPYRGDQSLITMATAEDQQKKSEMNDQLREYISQWRDERAKEEAELKRLKDKQAARKEIRAEQEKKQAARKEMSKSKEQVEEEMKISLSIRIKPLALAEMDSDELKNKANQIWNTIVALETDKYDYEQRQLDQDYEFKELAERQKLQLRNKAIKKGLDPESFTQKHPPTIHMFSKYERRRPLLRRLPRRSTRKRKRITRRRRRKRSKFKAGPNFHHHLLGLKSKSYPFNKRHSIRVIASIPRGFLRPADHRHVSRKVHNLQFVIAICLETRQVPVRICYASKIRSP